MLFAVVVAVLLLSTSIASAQKLPGDFTCQDLIDHADGKVSRSTDGGKTYVPINVPRPQNASGYAMLTYATLQCRRLASGEISIGEFDALNAEKARQLKNDDQKLQLQKQNAENQEQALRNQERAIQTQREAAAMQARQVEATRRQQAAQHKELLHQQERAAILQAQQAEAARRQ